MGFGLAAGRVEVPVVACLGLTVSFHEFLHKAMRFRV